MRARGIVALLALVLCPWARAQTGRAAPPVRPRDEVLKMIDAYIVSNLQESLGLSDEQFVKVLPLLRRLQTDRRSYADRRHALMQEMRRSLAAGRATEPRIAEAMRDLHALENDEPAIIRKDVDALDAVLTPTQQAKLRLLQVQVEQRLRELLNRRQQQRPGARAIPEEPEPE